VDDGQRARLEAGREELALRVPSGLEGVMEERGLELRPARRWFEAREGTGHAHEVLEGGASEPVQGARVPALHQRQRRRVEGLGFEGRAHPAGLTAEGHRVLDELLRLAGQHEEVREIRP
jgi:hypothetical protein